MGYIGQSRSERSQEAIDAGLLTHSELKAWQKRAVKANAVYPCEWHHTGKYYNKTNYYNPEDFKALDPLDFPPAKKEKKKDTYAAYGCAVWGGTKRHPKIVDYETGIIKNPTKAQLFANKYSHYDGFIYLFGSERDAQHYFSLKTDKGRHNHVIKKSI